MDTINKLSNVFFAILILTSVGCFVPGLWELVTRSPQAVVATVIVTVIGLFAVKELINLNTSRI